MTDRLDSLGGSLSVDAAPGRGTRITGRLPIENESLPATAPGPSAMSPA
jgi:signal transduction histidine kinase